MPGAHHLRPAGSSDSMALVRRFRAVIKGSGDLRDISAISQRLPFRISRPMRLSAMPGTHHGRPGGCAQQPCRRGSMPDGRRDRDRCSHGAGRPSAKEFEIPLRSGIGGATQSCVQQFGTAFEEVQHRPHVRLARVSPRITQALYFSNADLLMKCSFKAICVVREASPSRRKNFVPPDSIAFTCLRSDNGAEP